MSVEVRAEEGSCCQRWSFRLKDCKLTCNNLSDVCCRQNGLPLAVYFLYRFIMAAYFFAFLIYFMIITFEGIFGAKFFIYLTDWTYMEVTLYFCVAFINVLTDFILDYRGSESRRAHRFRYQLQWLLYNISITTSLMVSLVYWPILRPMIPDNERPPLQVDLSIHLYPSIFCLLDLFITRVPLRFAHFLYPFLFAIIYGLFTIIYWAAGGTDPYGNPYIYPITDLENHPGIAVATMVGVVIAIMLLHGLLKLLFVVRFRYIDLRGVTAPDEAEGDREHILHSDHQQDDVSA